MMKENVDSMVLKSTEYSKPKANRFVVLIGGKARKFFQVTVAFTHICAH
jgi:hypothetical protein